MTHHGHSPDGPTMGLWLLLRWIRNTLFFIFGPTILYWFLCCFLYPMLISVIPLEWAGLTYNGYKVHLAHQVRAAQVEVEQYGWGRSTRAYDVANDQVISTSLGFLEYRATATPIEAMSGKKTGQSSDEFFKSIDSVLEDLNRFCQREWIPINRAFFITAGIRLQLWAVPLLLLLLLSVAAFFSGEYASRERFEENIPPSSGRSKMWMRVAYVGGPLLINLPSTPFSFPFLYVGILGGIFFLMSIHFCRAEAIEFV